MHVPSAAAPSVEPMFASVISPLAAVLRCAFAHARAFVLLEDAPATLPAPPLAGGPAAPVATDVGACAGDPRRSRQPARPAGKPASGFPCAHRGRGRRAGSVPSGAQPCQLALTAPPAVAGRLPHAEPPLPAWRARVRA